jgi:hypothetical protein
VGSALIKPDPNDDFYVVYSSIVDLPVLWGSRKKLLKKTKKNWDSDEWFPKTKDLDRADRNPYPGFQDIDGVTWLQKGALPVNKLKDMCGLLDLGVKPDDPRILEALDTEGWY